MDTEVCFRCDCPTGNAGKGDDSLYAPNGAGPYCPACFELVFELANLRAENERLSASESDWHKVADLRAVEIDRLRAEIERLKRDVEHYAQAILWEGDMIVTQTRYQQVHAHIAELEAECERLRSECAGIKTAFYQRAEVRNLQSRLEASEAECEELRADVVWAYCELASDDTREFFGMPVEVETDNEARRAVREARNGVS